MNTIIRALLISLLLVFLVNAQSTTWYVNFDRPIIDGQIYDGSTRARAWNFMDDYDGYYGRETGVNWSLLEAGDTILVSGTYRPNSDYGFFIHSETITGGQVIIAEDWHPSYGNALFENSDTLVTVPPFNYLWSSTSCNAAIWNTTGVKFVGLTFRVNTPRPSYHTSKSINIQLMEDSLITFEDCHIITNGIAGNIGMQGCAKIEFINCLIEAEFNYFTESNDIITWSQSGWGEHLFEGNTIINRNAYEGESGTSAGMTVNSNSVVISGKNWPVNLHLGAAIIIDTVVMPIYSNTSTTLQGVDGWYLVSDGVTPAPTPSAGNYTIMTLAHKDVMQMGYGYNPQRPTTKFVNNFIYVPYQQKTNTWNQGHYLGTNNDPIHNNVDSSMQNFVYINNIFNFPIDTTGNGVAIAVQNWDWSGCRSKWEFYNNTFITSGGWFQSQAADSIFAYNNVFVTLNRNGITRLARSDRNNSVDSIDYNYWSVSNWLDRAWSDDRPFLWDDYEYLHWQGDGTPTWQSVGNDQHSKRDSIGTFEFQSIEDSVISAYAPPAILRDAGKDLSYLAAKYPEIMYDIEGNERNFNGGWDIGALEFQAETADTTNWYVATDGNDSNEGTEASPFLTIQHAYSVAEAGDSIYVADGIYNTGTSTGETFIRLTKQGTSTNPITLKSETRHGAVIDLEHNTDGSHNIGVQFNGRYHIFDGFRVTGAVTMGIYTNASYNKIINCEIDSNGIVGVTAYGQIGLFERDTAGYNLYARNYFHHNGRQLGAYGDHGLYLAGSNDSIYYNIFAFNASYGVQLSGSDNMNVYNNTFVHNGSGGLNMTNSAVDSVNIRNNVFSENNGRGYTSSNGYAIHAGTTISDVHIYDNLFNEPDGCSGTEGCLWNFGYNWGDWSGYADTSNVYLHSGDLFVDDSSDYHIAYDNAGINTAYGWGQTMDYDLQPKVSDEWDIGALEYQGAIVDSTPSNVALSADFLTAELNTAYQAFIYDLTGFDSGYVYIDRGWYNIDGSPTFRNHTEHILVYPNDDIALWDTSSTEYSTTQTITLRIGDASDTWTIRTKDPAAPDTSAVTILRDANYNLVISSNGKLRYMRTSGYAPPADPILDTIPPAPPTSFTATNTGSQTEFQTTWALPDETDLAAIQYYEGSANDTTTMSLITTLGEVGGYLRTGRTANTTYWGAVKAVDDSGNVSYFSNTASVTTSASESGTPLANLDLAYLANSFAGHLFDHSLYPGGGDASTMQTDMTAYNTTNSSDGSITRINPDYPDCGDMIWDWNQVMRGGTEEGNTSPNQNVVTEYAIPSTYSIINVAIGFNSAAIADEPGWNFPWVVDESDTVTYPNGHIMGAYKYWIRQMVSAMERYPDKYWVLWNIPPVDQAAGNSSGDVQRQADFNDWMVNTLQAGLDATYGAFPSNVYIFDVFTLLKDPSSNFMNPTYSDGGNDGDSHPNDAGQNAVAPAYIQRVFDNARAYRIP